MIQQTKPMQKPQKGIWNDAVTGILREWKLNLIEGEKRTKNKR